VTRSRAIALVLVAVAGVAVGGYVAYDQVLRGDDVAALSLPTDATSSPDATTVPTASTAPAGTDSGVAGEWQVAGGSVAGYRVRERLANLAAESDAVGRTEAVSGSITVEAEGDGAILTGGTLEVDTTTLRSDEGRRDNRLRSEGLQTDQYPTATFVVTQPVNVPAAALADTPTDVTLVGDLTLHGVTKSVEIPAQAQLADGRIQVAGSLTFPLADFDITAPNVGGFILSIADEGTLEFLVAFERG
jgi:polyisoprenoid-binding protein YceI